MTGCLGETSVVQTVEEKYDREHFMFRRGTIKKTAISQPLNIFVTFPDALTMYTLMVKQRINSEV